MSWQIDPAHSSIEFSARHLMISTVRGRFENFTGTVEFDEQNPARTQVDLQIEAASLNSREPKRDAHLKSPDFLDVENHPYITFRSKRVKVQDAHHALLVGDLTIRGVTREVTLDVEYSGQVALPWGAINAGFSATTKINRKDWGLNWNMVMEAGALLVSEEVTIHIDLELTKQIEQAAVLEAVPA